MTTQTQYERQFIMQSHADDTEWRKATEARTLMNLVNQRTAGHDLGDHNIREDFIITTHFGIHARIVAATDEKSVQAVHAPNMAIINIPMLK